jgi:hypothetical protein
MLGSVSEPMMRFKTSASVAPIEFGENLAAKDDD